ncbi:ATP-grasp domain-containing protein [Amycolatopsis sp. VS8301801F10]|uniref:ATP-grasp domain-containing protein n=1 Tax=unclassified Amycolatopsis TaxID=2618356 RepID=UPI0038FC4632
MKCAIVDAYGIGRYLPAALRRHGVEPVHVRSEFPDVHLSYRPEDFEIDLQHDGDLTATAAKLRELGVGFVVAAMESGVLLADALSAELGTPGNGMTTPAARRNKHLMVQAVQRAGLAVADSFASPSADEVVAWAQTRGEWPVVLKPTTSAGMDNVHFCHTADDIRAGHASIMAASTRYGQKNDTALAQGYLDGDEYFVNTVSREGKHHIVEIWRYRKHQIDATRSMVSNEHPVAYDDPDAKQVGEYALGVLDALEIRNGAAHTEIMQTANGPVLVESGARLGGAHLPDIVTRSIGTNQVDLLAKTIAAPEEVIEGKLPTYQLLNHVRFMNLIVPLDGVVPDDAGWNPVRALESFLELIVTQPAGKRIERTVDLATSPGNLYLTNADPDRLDADYQRVRELERTTLYRPHQ